MDREGMLRDARAFLEMLFGDVPDGQIALTWTLEGKHSSWHAANQWEKIAAAVAGKKDVYVGVSLTDREKSTRERVLGNETTGILGLWCDIDYEDGKAHKPRPEKLPLPPDEESALKLLDSMGLKPTITVHSGHGIQAWWLFKEPMIFEKNSDRMAAAVMSRSWQQTLSARAMEFGWSADSVHDLARILRIPGTINAKTEPHVLAQMLDCSGPRYEDITAFEPYLIEVSPEKAAAVAHAVGLKPPGEARGMDYWREVIGGTSEGGRDNAITSLNGKLLSLVDLENAEAVELMLNFALLVNERNSPPLPPEDIRRSFFSVMKAEKSRRAALNAEAEFDNDPNGLMATEGSTDQRMEILGRLLSHSSHPLPLARVVKLGRAMAEFTFILKDDSEIVVGPILNQGLVRKAILDHTAGKHGNPIVVPRYKAAEWELKICSKIAAVAEEVVIPELERTGGVQSILEYYISRAKNDNFHDDTSWETAIGERFPFTLNGELYVCISTILPQVKLAGYQVTERDMRIGLMKLGFTPERMTARIPDGKGGINRYYARYMKAPISSLAREISELFDSSENTSESGPENR